MQMFYRRDTPIGPGAKVMQGETLIKLPDMSGLKVVTKLQEAQVNQLRTDPTKKMQALVHIVGLERPIAAWVSNVSVVPDSSQRWWDPDLKEFPVDLTLDENPPGLKPGASADVEIFVNRLANVLSVPLAAVYTAGTQRYVFVRQNGAVKPTPVTLGSCTDTHAQVVGGLDTGADVLLLAAGQGHELLEHAGIKPPSMDSPALPAPDAAKPAVKVASATPTADASAAGAESPATQPVAIKIVAKTETAETKSDSGGTIRMAPAQ
jgi:hypothetical protein